jgi:hypothetical protein
VPTEPLHPKPAASKPPRVNVTPEDLERFGDEEQVRAAWDEADSATSSLHGDFAMIGRSRDDAAAATLCVMQITHCALRSAGGATNIPARPH